MQYLVTFTLNTNCSNLSNIANNIQITGPHNGWSCQSSYSLTDLDGDGIWSGSFVLPQGDFSYKYCADNWSQSEDLLAYGTSTGDWSCIPITDYWSYAHRKIGIQGNLSIFDTWGSCLACVGGCLDSLASNYNPNANYDNGTCIYNTSFNVTFKLI